MDFEHLAVLPGAKECCLVLALLYYGVFTILLEIKANPIWQKIHELVSEVSINLFLISFTLNKTIFFTTPHNIDGKYLPLDCAHVPLNRQILWINTNVLVLKRTHSGLLLFVNRPELATLACIVILGEAKLLNTALMAFNLNRLEKELSCYFILAKLSFLKSNATVGRIDWFMRQLVPGLVHCDCDIEALLVPKHMRAVKFILFDRLDDDIILLVQKYVDFVARVD